MEKIEVRYRPNDLQAALWESSPDSRDRTAPLNFSWVVTDKDGGLRNLHKPLSCRDHMIDLLEIFTSDYAKRRYAANFNVASGDYDLQPHKDATQLLLTCYTKKTAAKLEENFPFLLLQEFTHFKSMAPSELFKVASVKGAGEDSDISYYLVKGDATWSKAACLNSLYTLLLRLIPEVKKPDTSLEELVALASDPELAKSAQYQLRTDLNYLKGANAMIKLGKLLPAMERMDFSKASSASGMCELENYAHSRGGLVYTVHSAQTPSYWQLNHYSKQLGELFFAQR